MPRIIEQTVYQFSELSDKAKEKTRDWFRSSDEFSPDFIIQNAVIAAEYLGITFDQQPVKLMNGQTRYDPAIYWSLSYCQGDGACFKGSYRYAKGAVDNLKAEFPLDSELHKIAAQFQAIQKNYFYGITANVTTTGRYQHSHTMRAEVVDRNDNEVNADCEESILSVLRDFADWIYESLKSEYESTQTNEYVDDGITANEYEFFENGERV